MKSVDTRGLSCPEPVLRAREQLETLAEGDSLDVLVDTVTARENVTRAAISLGFDVEVEASAKEFVVHIKKTS